MSTTATPTNTKPIGKKPDERKLLAEYRRMGPSDRDFLRQMSAYLAKHPPSKPSKQESQR